MKTISNLNPLYSVPNSFKELLNQCIIFYQNNQEKLKSNCSQEIREKIIRFIKTFQKDCGTQNTEAVNAINKVTDKKCLFLMTAHQPNLFAYSGVLRKATLTFTLERELGKRLDIPVVSFFGIADQDFTDDRWVKSSHLPAVNRKEGILTLQMKLPKEKMANRVPKPSIEKINRWKEEIRNWLKNAINSVNTFHKSNRTSKWNRKEDMLKKNFEEFWKTVEEAHEKSTTYSDFNAFIMSKIVNEIWGYDTLFSRFSECQQIFKQEFEYLLSNFKECSEALTEVNKLMVKEEGETGVSEKEPELAPFWYHCDCGSKVRLSLVKQDHSLIGYGRCMGCSREYRIGLGTTSDPDVSAISTRISARAIPMTLIFFKGLGVSCYVGGIGGHKYLKEAQYVADKLQIPFPPVAFWRPHDRYNGIAQLQAILEFQRITGSPDVSNWEREVDIFRSRIEKVYARISELEAEKQKTINRLRQGEQDRETLLKEIRSISISQSKIKKESNLSVLNRDLKILENVQTVLNLIPSIIDYAVNIGLRETSEQWMKHLKTNGSLHSDIHLKSVLDDLIEPKSGLRISEKTNR